MAQTKAGGIKSRDKILANDPNFYKKLGKLGGSKGAADGVIKGFAAMTYEERAAAGKKGGTISRRNKHA